VHNVPQLQEVGGFQHEYSCEEPNIHKPQMFLRNTKPPIYCRCCYASCFQFCHDTAIEQINYIVPVIIDDNFLGLAPVLIEGYFLAEPFLDSLANRPVKIT